MLCPQCGYIRNKKAWIPSQWTSESAVTSDYRQCEVCDGELEHEQTWYRRPESSTPQSRPGAQSRAPRPRPFPFPGEILKEASPPSTSSGAMLAEARLRWVLQSTAAQQAPVPVAQATQRPMQALAALFQRLPVLQSMVARQPPVPVAFGVHHRWLVAAETPKSQGFVCRRAFGRGPMRIRLKKTPHLPSWRKGNFGVRGQGPEALPLSLNDLVRKKWLH